MRRLLPLFVVLLVACGSQPVVSGSPWEIIAKGPAGVNKVDLLLAIDDSPAMADKQQILANALPVLVQRVLHDFSVKDLHIAVVSSSLGGGGSPDVCVGQDNHARLMEDFLTWVPSSSEPQLVASTQTNALVGEAGCGLEAQLESWYRFLIQPDPYDHIALSTDNPPKASLVGVDATLLKMRHDFLRPDSAVVIVQLTDEEDSWSDPLWLGGYGWTARTANFPGGPGGGAGPRGTSECDEPEDLGNPTSWGPNNPDCTSCAFPGSKKPVAQTDIGQDPNCNACAGGETTCPQKGWYTPAAPTTAIAAADGLNARYGNQYMRTRYGFDNQHDVQRYVDGLSMATVPDRDNEAHPPNPYSTTKRNCTNPLFAEDLPDGTDTSPGALCGLKSGPRTPDMVFYALIGGVSPSLVPATNLTADDWMKIVGKDPAHYVFDGIDPHMIQATSPRVTLGGAGSSYTLGTDVVTGREWNTLTSASGIDLEYACTFDLPKPKDCTLAVNAPGCDCFDTTSPDSAPLCDPSTRTMQVRGKAYPTTRELRVAKGLGTQASIASICTTDDTPAMDAIANKLIPVLGAPCFPSLIPSACVMLTFGLFNGSLSCDTPGLTPATPAMMAALGSNHGTACVIEQTCDGPGPSWCDTQNVQGCANRITVTGVSSGTQIILMCTATVTN